MKWPRMVLMAGDARLQRGDVWLVDFGENLKTLSKRSVGQLLSCPMIGSIIRIYG